MDDGILAITVDPPDITPMELAKIC